MGFFDRAIWISNNDREWFDRWILKESVKRGKSLTQPEGFAIMRSKIEEGEHGTGSGKPENLRRGT